MPDSRGVIVLTGWAAGLLVAGVALLLMTGPVLEAVSAAAGPDAVVAAVAAVTAWLVLGWLALGLSLTLGELAAGVWAGTPHGGRRFAALLETLALTPVREAVRSSLRVGAVGLVGGTVAVASISPSAAWASAEPAVARAGLPTADVRETDRLVPPRWPSLDRPAQPVPVLLTQRPAAPPGRDRDPRAASTYRVRVGDTLWSISRRHLGEGSRYGAIQRANRKKIRNPHRIYPGQRLRLP